MPKDFEDIQQEELSQMQQGEGRVEQEMAEAASDLSRASQQNAHTIDTLTQSIHQVEGQISQLTTQVQQMAMESGQKNIQAPSTATPSGGQPPISSGLQSAGQMAGQGAAAAGGVVAGMASQKINQVSQMGHDAFRQDPVATGAHPGYLEAKPGLVGGISQASGMFYDPAKAKGYNFGAYQRAQARAAGQGAQDIMQGTIQGVGTLASGQFWGGIGGSEVGGVLGGVAGGAIGGPPGAAVGTLVGGAAGGMAGSALGSAADNMNPAMAGLSNMNKMVQYGAAANETSYQFLRGRGGADPGRFNQYEEARIGSGIQEEMYKDLQYGSKELQQIQSQFSRAGLMEGTQTADEYVKNFEELIQAHKKISKSLQMSYKEATEFMSGAVNEMGYTTDPSALGELATQTRATAHLAGMSPEQVSQVGIRGAQQASQMGMMARSGSQMARGAASTAGISQMKGFRTGGEEGVGANLLASVGGEEGLRQLIQQSTQRFMKGTGGNLMAMGGADAGSYREALTQASGEMNTSEDIIDFMANRHRKKQNVVDQLGGGLGTQSKQLQYLFNMAKRMPGGQKGGEDLQNVMQMLAQSQYDMSASEAEALVESGKTIPETMRRKRRRMSQERVDTKMSQLAERKSIPGRVRTEFREAAEQGGVPFLRKSAIARGVGKPLSWAAQAGAAAITPGTYQESESFGDYFRNMRENIGQTGQWVQNEMQDFNDWRYGVTRRSASQEDVENVTRQLKEGNVFQGGSGTGEGVNVELENQMRQATGRSDLMKRYLEAGGDKAKAAIVASRESVKGYVDSEERMKDYLDRVRAGKAGQDITEGDIMSAREGGGIDTEIGGKSIEEAIGGKNLSAEKIVGDLTENWGGLDIEGKMTDEAIGEAVRSDKIQEMGAQMKTYLKDMRTDRIGKKKTKAEKSAREQLVQRANKLLDADDKQTRTFAREMLQSAGVDTEGGVTAEEVEGMEYKAFMGRLGKAEEDFEKLNLQKGVKRRLGKAADELGIAEEELYDTEKTTTDRILERGGAASMYVPGMQVLGGAAGLLGYSKGDKREMVGKKEQARLYHKRLSAMSKEQRKAFREKHGKKAKRLFELADQEQWGSQQRNEALSLLAQTQTTQAGKQVDTKGQAKGAKMEEAKSVKQLSRFLQQQTDTMNEIKNALMEGG